MPFDGTRIAERDKESFALEHDGTRITFRGASKRAAARRLDALATNLTA